MGHPRRDEQAAVDRPVELENLGRAVGGGSHPQIVQNDSSPPPEKEPVVGLVEVVVQPDNGTCLLLRTVCLDHLTAEPKPRPAVGLDEAATLIAVDVRLDHHDVGDHLGGNDGGHGPKRYSLGVEQAALSSTKVPSGVTTRCRQGKGAPAQVRSHASTP